MSRREWTREALTSDRFIGWVPWSACPAALSQIAPGAGGVYVVYRPSLASPEFIEKSPAGIWRGDPTVRREALEANWVPRAQVLNIGKANHGRLRDRLKEYINFGRGGRSRHAGGRLIWQLADSEDLLVAWKSLSRDTDPEAEERTMIARFRADYGKPPFANNPDRMGR